MTALATPAALAAVWLAGHLALRLLRPGGTVSPGLLLRELPEAFGLGACLLFLNFLWASWLGPVAAWQSWLVVLGLLAGRHLLRRSGSAGEARAGAPGPAGPWSRGDKMLLAALALAVLAAAWMTLSLPLLGWDTRIIWAFKAKVLAAEGTIVSEPFRDPYRLHIHPRYPLLVPWLASFVAAPGGTFSERRYQLLVLVFAALALAKLYRLARRRGGRRAALALTLAMAATGSWLAGVFDSAAEVVLVYFMLASLDSAAEWSESRRPRDLLLGGTFLFGAAMTKNEGVLLAAGLVAALVAASPGRRRLAAGAALLTAGFFLILCAGWVAHLVRIPPVSDENYPARLSAAVLAAGWPKVPEILRAVLAEVSDLGQWHLVWPALLLGAVRTLLPGRGGRAVLPAVTALFYLGGIMAAYVLSPWRDPALHVRVTFDRVMLPLLPLALLMFSVEGLKSTRRDV